MQPHPIEHIQTRLDFIQTVLESNYIEEGAIIVDRLTAMGAYMAEAGKLLADAEFHMKQKLQIETIQALHKLIPEYASATVQNAVIKGCAAYESSLVTYADRVNRSCTHQIDVMRTQLSYLKSTPKF